MDAYVRHRRGRPIARSSADTRARILQAARDAFAELGYEATTMREVAARADLTRPAINHYFTGKPALYRAVLAQTGDLVTIALDEARQQVGLIARLSTYLTAVAQPTEENRTGAAFVVSAMLDAQRQPELAPLVGELQVGTQEFLHWAITDAVACGELTTDVATDALVQMLAALLWGVGFYGAFVGDSGQSAAVTENLQRLLVNRLWQIK
ncbi:TetR/AcrR family transcriptional regulator [Mycobacterium sp. M1]|uniref:TetR/AcrR family transcriptional regulator n=1 Tax=Mycolicibacter acidiphilus TaxID=2835306 RepID=A0ABS5RRL6_9MYCO|nr:TetR/AcrR family transcriptional regulator [Mycolicibacter acidiphilus]MBS9536199.1 TetR/AcrR family transcriptional regulator [Mycolicibacter acidiphilus]